MATFRPARRPLRSRIVNASSSACVGCSCMPSPALMIAGAADARQQVTRARRAVAQHDHARRHRLDVHRRVDQRLALDDARRADGDVERVGAEALLGDLERRARARARLEEQVDDGAAAQRRHLLDRALADFLHRFGGVEDQHDLLGAEIGDAEQILAAKRGERLRRRVERLPWLTPRSAMTTSSVAVDLLQAHLHALAAATSARSCRRSRP